MSSAKPEDPSPAPLSLSHTTGRLAHDYNNMLTVITGNLALAERHAAGNPKLIRLLDNMRQAAERGVVLTCELMALSQDHAPPFSEQSGRKLVAAPHASARILVVEDDPQVAEVAVAVLESIGYAVELRPDASSALAFIQTNQSVDLVFSDIVMPGPMNGIELAETIAALLPKLPILLATGYSNAALIPGTIRFPVLAKPYSVQELSRRVALAIASAA